MIAINNLSTPSPPSKDELKTHTSTFYSSHSTIMLNLLVLNLASNAAPHSSLLPKICSHYATKTIVICAPFKR